MLIFDTPEKLTNPVRVVFNFLLPQSQPSNNQSDKNKSDPVRVIIPS
jgi:hypothetical protein